MEFSTFTKLAYGSIWVRVFSLFHIDMRQFCAPSLFDFLLQQARFRSLVYNGKYTVSRDIAIIQALGAYPTLGGKSLGKISVCTR